MKIKITVYLKLTLITLSCLFINSALQSQATNTEGFESTTFLPSGWSAVGTSNLWSRRTTGTFPTCNPFGGVSMVRFSSRAQTAGTNQTISTPVIDYSSRGNSNAYISFYIYRDAGSVNGDSLSLYINTSASLSGAVHFGTVARYTRLSVPDTVAFDGWYKYSFNVPSSFKGNTNYILIKGVSQNGYNLYIDDFEWNSFPNQCSGTPGAGTINSSVGIICNGGGSANLSLSGQTTGVSGLSYQWKNATSASGPWTNVGNNSTTLNTGNITSNQYYRCVVSCSYSGLSDSTPDLKITVKTTNSPQVIVLPNNASFCAGTGGAKLVASGASTYVWTPAAGLSSTSSDTVYAAPNVSTTYTVRGTDTAGCTAQATANVTLRQSPTVNIVSPDTNMCLTDSVQLTAQTGGGGNTYSWSPSGKTSAGIFAKPAVSTRYTVTVTNGFGCKGTASRTVNVVQKPRAKFEVNIVNRTYSFTDSSTNATSVFYDFGDGNSSNSRNPVYTYSFTGTHTIMMVAYNPPCGNDTFYRTFNVSSIVSVHNPSFSLYPVPAKDILHVMFNSANSQPIGLYDLSGRLLLEVQAAGETQIEIDLSTLSPGLYSVRQGNAVEVFSKE